MTDRELWQALGYRVERRSLGICGEGYVLLLPDGGYGPGCGEGRGWGNEPAAWAQLPSADTWEGMGLVIEAMEAKGYHFWLQVWGEKPEAIFTQWSSVNWDGGERFSRADTAPCAVRLAAIRALGVGGE